MERKGKSAAKRPCPRLLPHATATGHGMMIKRSFIFVFLALAACSPKVDNRGFVTDQDWKQEISVGKTTKDDVIARFGSPSSRSSFGQESWYYITQRKETLAFMEQEIAKQDVVRIEFDPSGVVSKLEQFNEADSREVDIAKRTTPTEGHSLSFFEQIVGNIGRFNKAGGDSLTTGRRTGR